MKIPKKITLRLGPARRLYVKRLLMRGLSGDTAQEVCDTLFCRGLQQCVPAEWMRDAADRAAGRVLKSKPRGRPR